MQIFCGVTSYPGIPRRIDRYNTCATCAISCALHRICQSPQINRRSSSSEIRLISSQSHRSAVLFLLNALSPFSYFDFYISPHEQEYDLKMLTRGAQVTGVAVCSLCLTWISCSLRGYVRLRILKFFGREDWLTVASLVCPFIRRCFLSSTGI